MSRTPHVIGLTSLSDIAKNDMANNAKGSRDSVSVKIAQGCSGSMVDGALLLHLHPYKKGLSLTSSTRNKLSSQFLDHIWPQSISSSQWLSLT